MCWQMHIHKVRPINAHTHAHRAAWVKKHRQHPSKLSWPRWLALPLGTVRRIHSVDFCSDKHRCSAQTQRPLHTHGAGCREDRTQRRQEFGQDEPAVSLSRPRRMFIKAGLWTRCCMFHYNHMIPPISLSIAGVEHLAPRDGREKMFCGLCSVLCCYQQLALSE